MLEIVLTISQRLCDDGISRGDRIAVCSENWIELWLLTLACWKSNVVIVPASTRYPVQKLQDALDSVCCDVLFTSGDCDKEILGFAMILTLKRVFYLPRVVPAVPKAYCTPLAIIIIMHRGHCRIFPLKGEIDGWYRCRCIISAVFH